MSKSHMKKDHRPKIHPKGTLLQSQTIRETGEAKVRAEKREQSAEIEGCPEHLSKVNYFALQSLENSLEDEITYKAYYDSIVDNRHLFEGRHVMHITEGVNCLYSFFAAEAGSKKVYCVLTGKGERQVQNIYMIRELIQENQMEDVIEVFSWNDFNVEVDIIIAEPMGYCLHFDGILDRIIEARDLFLSKKGIILPNTLSFKCAVIHDQHFYDHKVEYWNKVYGVPMTSMKKWISHQPIIRIVDPALIVSKVSKVITFDLEKDKYEDIIAIDRVLELQFMGECKANGVSFWFETTFDHGIEKREIKASPWVASTKFTQATLYWPTVEDCKGGKIRFKFKGQKRPTEGYSLITTEVDSKKYQYSFS